jgi:1,4-alpha-glucan branching enzyme
MASKTKGDGAARRRTTSVSNGPKAKGAKRAKRIEFAVEAPHADSVGVTGTFCDWKDVYPLKRQRDGQWKRALNLVPGRYEYLFVVDGEWRDDPRSGAQVQNPYGGVNSVVDVR